MPKTLVLGKPPETTALKKVLKTCTDWSAQASLTDAEWLAHSGDVTPQQRTAWRSDLKKYDTVVALPSLLRQAPEALSLVHRLRTDLYWTGRFIAVLRNYAQAKRLEAASFVGEAIDGTRFGEVSGHDVLTAPVRLSELLIVLGRPVPIISLEYWHFDLLRTSRAAELDRQIRKGERWLDQGRIETDACICRNILAALSEIDWGFVPAQGEDGHALKNRVRSFISQYAAKEQLTPDDCSAIIEEAKKVLARSSFPFPVEE